MATGGAGTRGRRIALLLAAVALVIVAAWWWLSVRGDGDAPGRIAQGDDGRVAGDAPDRSRSASAATPTTGARRRAGATASSSADIGGDLEQDPEDVACGHALDAAMRALHATLREDRSPGEAAAKVLLQPMPPETRATVHPEDTDAVDALSAAMAADTAARHAAYARATTRWPDDLDLAWLRAQSCWGESCDADDAMARLQRLDGDNAATWMLAMTSDRAKRDDAAFASALARAVAAPRYAPPDGVVFAAVRPELESLDPDPRCLARMDDRGGATLTAAAFRDAYASMHDLGQGWRVREAIAACFDVDDRRPDVRASCTLLVERMATSETTLLGRGMALAHLLREDPAGTRWREAYRRSAWLRQVMGELARENLPDFAARMARMPVEGEIATLEAIAREHGRWPPPAGWLPDDPHARALVTGAPLPLPRPSH